MIPVEVFCVRKAARESALVQACRMFWEVFAWEYKSKNENLDGLHTATGRPMHPRFGIHLSKSGVAISTASSITALDENCPPIRTEILLG